MSAKNIDDLPNYTGNNEKKVKDLLMKIAGNDNKINGTDLDDIKSLVSEFESDKNDILQNTKKEIIKILVESLNKGFTVNNEQDYEVLLKILQLIDGNYKLPDYNLIKKSTSKKDKGLFSVILDSKNRILQVYVRQKYMQNITTNTDLYGTISLDSGKYEEVGFWNSIFNFDDDIYNNNLIKIPIQTKNELETKQEMPVIQEQEPKVTSTPEQEQEQEPKVTSTPEQEPKVQDSDSTVIEKQKLLQAIVYNKRYNSDQLKLIQQIVGLKGNDIDGVVGQKTIDAIKKFQKENGLVVDGKVGPLTLGKMEGEGYGYKIEKCNIVQITLILNQDDNKVKPQNAYSETQKPDVKAEIPKSDIKAETPNIFDYKSLQDSIKNFNDNEDKFLFADGVTYFGDNFSSNKFSGFSIRKGLENFRIIINNDGSFTTFDTTGIEYHYIQEQAKQVNSGKITMKGDKFDFTSVIK